VPELDLKMASSNSEHPSLPLDMVAKAKADAQKDALFAGLTAGLVASVIGSRLFGFGRNKSMFTGLATGAVSGYFFAQGFASSRMSQLGEQERMLRRNLDE